MRDKVQCSVNPFAKFTGADRSTVFWATAIVNVLHVVTLK